MKKLIVKSMLLLGILIPVQAQNEFLIADQQPVIKASIPASQLPSEVLETVSIKFDRSNPGTWSKFPLAMADFGWVYDMGNENSPLEHFEVKLRTTREADYWAKYTKAGELIESREETKNAVIPTEIMKEFKSGDFGDWKIIESNEIVRFNHDPVFRTADVKYQYRLTVEKDGNRKSIPFNFRGSEKAFDYTAYTEADKIKYSWLVNR
jgi:hypothetical protein